MNFKIAKSIFYISILLVTSFICLTESCSLAQEVSNRQNKLIVIYRVVENHASQSPTEQATTPTTAIASFTSEKMPFEAILNKAIDKVIEQENVLPQESLLRMRNKNLRFQQTQEEIAVIEKAYEKIDTYIVEVKDSTKVDSLKVILEEEPGIVVVMKNESLKHHSEPLNNIDNITPPSSELIPETNIITPAKAKPTDSCSVGEKCVVMKISN